MTNNKSTWYTSWFDTPFYHILYKDRDSQEAHLFMDNLTSYLNIPIGGTILDLACGKGRHSWYLAKIGYDVTGVDLSENSIRYAQQFENAHLHFEVHDMCKPYPRQFDAVFNLFTSFGYFEKDEDNLNTVMAIRDTLNEQGFGVIDFMNVDYVIDNLITEDTKFIDGITFNLNRYVKGEHIYKEISFEYKNEAYHFTERVRAFNLAEFQELFNKAGVYLLDIFGDYKLRKFDPKNSERLIMIFK